MNRRGFLAAIGLAPVAAVSIPVKASEPVTVTVAASFDEHGFAAVVAEGGELARICERVEFRQAERKGWTTYRYGDIPTMPVEFLPRR